VPNKYLTSAVWADVEHTLNVRLKGGAAFGGKRKVGLLHPLHTVADLLNLFDKIDKPMPNDGMRCLQEITGRIFHDEPDKQRAAMNQFQKYWSEAETFKPLLALCDQEMRGLLYGDAKTDEERETRAQELQEMRPLQKCLHKLKVMPQDRLTEMYITWVRGVAPELTELAVTVHSILAGCVRVERSVKVQKLIHSKQRNRLLHEKVRKLVYIYMNSRILNKFPPELYALEDLLEEHIDDDLEDVIARTLAQTDDCIFVE
jgi:hypothetical protein